MSHTDALKSEQCTYNYIIMVENPNETRFKSSRSKNIKYNFIQDICVKKETELKAWPIEFWYKNYF